MTYPDFEPACQRWMTMADPRWDPWHDGSDPLVGGMLDAVCDWYERSQPEGYRLLNWDYIDAARTP